MPSAGVVIDICSWECCMAGAMIITTNRHTTSADSVSQKPRQACGSLFTSADMRMCSPRSSASTAPNMAIQINSEDASSSDQISGLWSR
ncbi:hypothetical protein D3C81_1707010 [compost metagenome]